MHGRRATRHASGTWVIIAVWWLAIWSWPARAGAQPARGDRAMLLDDPVSITELAQAREHLFGLEIAETDRRLYALARRSDGGPAARLHLAFASLLVALIEDRDEDFDRFFDRSDSLRAELKRAPRGTWRTLMEAETDFQRLVAWAKRGHYVRAAMAAASAYSKYEDVLDRVPGHPDALKGAGLFHAVIGSLPDFYRRFLTILGFDGRFDMGVRELMVAAERAEYMADEAALYLAFLDVVGLPVPVRALDVFTDLYGRHDSSAVVAMPYLDALMRERRVDTADSVLTTMRTRSESGRIHRVAYFTWFEGESAFRRGNFDRAADRFSHYVREHPGAALKATAWLRLGLAYDLTGRRAQAVEAYRSVTAAREFDSDAVATRWATRLLEAPPDRWERRMIAAANAFDRGDDDEADALLGALREDGALPQVWGAQLHYRLGRLRESQGRLRDAMAFFRLSVDRRGDPLGRWVAMSWLKIAEMEEGAGRPDSARTALEAVLAIEGDYDYRGLLRRRAEIGMDRLDDLQRR